MTRRDTPGVDDGTQGSSEDADGTTASQEGEEKIPEDIRDGVIVRVRYPEFTGGELIGRVSVFCRGASDEGREQLSPAAKSNVF